MTDPFSNVIALPGRDPTIYTVRLLHMDGRPWASAGFLPGLASAPWAWVVETVAHNLECDEDQVGCMETDDGDVVTVDGLPVYRIAC